MGEDHLKNPEVGAYFSKLGVDPNEVGKLFVLLDEDGSGCIDKDEFMFGCIRLKGEAKSLDLAILHREVQGVIHQMDCILQACTDRDRVDLPPVVPNAHLGMAVLRILRQDIRVLSEDLKGVQAQVRQNAATTSALETTLLTTSLRNGRI